MPNKTQQERIAELIREQIEVVPYDPAWLEMFENEAAHLLELFGTSHPERSGVPDSTTDSVALTTRSGVSKGVVLRAASGSFSKDEPMVRYAEPDGSLLTMIPVIRRIEHFGSTAVPGLPAKPVVDMLVEVSSYEDVEKFIVPALVPERCPGGGGESPSLRDRKSKQSTPEYCPKFADCYEYFWRPEFGDDGGEWYCWFIKRGHDGRRTHHIHMVVSQSRLWERLYFRDYLREFPGAAAEYARLKMESAMLHGNDRAGYTEAKGEFIRETTLKAIKYYKG